MNVALAKDITQKELSAAVSSMAKGKAPGHDGIPIEFFQKMWMTIGNDFHRMLLKGIEEGTLHEGVTRGLISLISKEGDSKDLKNGDPLFF